jgi:hypothetical protein
MFEFENEKPEELMNGYKEVKKDLETKGVTLSEYIEELKIQGSDEKTIERYQRYKKIESQLFLENDVLDLNSKMKPFPPNDSSNS